MKKALTKIAAVTLLSTTLVSTSANAIGMNPAMDDSRSKQITQSNKENILQSVRSELNGLLPMAKTTYKQTALFKALDTDYKSKGYPSKQKSKDGFDDSGNLMMDALKQPITQDKKIDLADQVRQYYYAFTPERSFQSLKASDPVVQEPETKLNYFDYIRLINTIRDNPNLTRDSRNKQLKKVENDLKGSIDTLFGANSSADEDIPSLSAWGQNKSVSIPFSKDTFSYMQLLAAYQKSEQISDVLRFYAAILDDLTAIRNYSVQIRQGNDKATINEQALIDRLSKTYKALDKSLIQPMVKVVNDQKAEKDAEFKAQEWQTSQLGELGLTKVDE